MSGMSADACNNTSLLPTARLWVLSLMNHPRQVVSHQHRRKVGLFTSKPCRVQAERGLPGRCMHKCTAAVVQVNPTLSAAAGTSVTPAANLVAVIRPVTKHVLQEKTIIFIHSFTAISMSRHLQPSKQRTSRHTARVLVYQGTCQDVFTSVATSCSPHMDSAGRSNAATAKHSQEAKANLANMKQDASVTKQLQAPACMWQSSSLYQSTG